MRACILPFCKSNNASTPGLSFFRLTDNRRERWLHAIGRQDEVSSKSSVCSEHFKAEDFEINAKGKRVLKCEAVPTQKLRPIRRQLYIETPSIQSELLLKVKVPEEDEEVEVCEMEFPQPSTSKIVVKSESYLIQFSELDNSYKRQQIKMDITIKEQLQHSVENFNKAVKEEPFNNEETSFQCSSSNKNITYEATNEEPFEDNLSDVGSIKIEEHNLEEFVQENIKTENYKIKPHHCTICDYKASQKQLLKRHMMKHTGEKPHQCTLCEYKCSQRNYLKSHILTHTGEKPYECAVCEYKGIYKHSLELHMMTHTGEKPHQCSVCDYKCSRKERLKGHMMTHTGEKPHQCALCEYKCSLRESLKVHMLKHTGEKQYECAVCEYKTIDKHTLKRHMMTHTGEKPYECAVCEYKGIYKHILKTHMMTHTGDKPHHCSICDYKCSLKNHLKKHMMTHTGEKPHHCTMCEYKCSGKHNLRRHMMTHGEKPHQ